MTQPVSRRAFRRRHGFLGVYLREGAPLTDALVYEAAELAFQARRDAGRTLGLFGTCGPEFKVAFASPPCEEYPALVLRGGPSPFYADAIPVLWPEDVYLHAQSPWHDPYAWLPGGRTEDMPSQPLMAFLEVTLATVSEATHKGLDDPAFSSSPGSFRKLPVARVYVAPEPLPPVHTSTVQLTLEGSYRGGRNVLYYVELGPTTVDGSGHGSTMLYWDDAGGAVTTEVTQRAESGTTRLPVASTDGFEAGDLIRVQGPGVSTVWYEIAFVEDRALHVRGSNGHEPATSMASLEVASAVSDATGALRVVFRGAVDLAVGERVEDLPEPHASSFSVRCWRVTHVHDQCGNTVVLLGTDGLTETVDPCDHDKAVALLDTAYAYERCLVVEDQLDWHPGLRVMVTASDVPAPAPCGKVEPCTPSREGRSEPEFFTISRIDRCCEMVACGCSGEAPQDELPGPSETPCEGISDDERPYPNDTGSEATRSEAARKSTDRTRLRRPPTTSPRSGDPDAPCRSDSTDRPSTTTSVASTRSSRAGVSSSSDSEPASPLRFSPWISCDPRQVSPMRSQEPGSPAHRHRPVSFLAAARRSLTESRCSGGVLELSPRAPMAGSNPTSSNRLTIRSACAFRWQP